MKQEIKEYPVFVRFCEKYCKILNSEYILVVDDWSFSKSIEWVTNLHYGPFANDGWEFITEDQFNEAHLRVNDFLNSFLPVTVTL